MMRRREETRDLWSVERLLQSLRRKQSLSLLSKYSYPRLIKKQTRTMIICSMKPQLCIVLRALPNLNPIILRIFLQDFVFLELTLDMILVMLQVLRWVGEPTRKNTLTSTGLQSRRRTSTGTWRWRTMVEVVEVETEVALDAENKIGR